MMLTGSKILNEVKNGNIEISDFDTKRLNPNSYNLRLDSKIKCFKENDSEEDPDVDAIHSLFQTIFQGSIPQVIDPKDPPVMEEYDMSESGELILYPNKLYLASTIEETFTDKYIPCISGRSSIGRLGLNVHVTAGFGDIGFRGKWTLELFCIEPIIIRPGMEICQIYFFEPSGDTSIQYHGKYQNQNDVEASQIYTEFN